MSPTRFTVAESPTVTSFAPTSGPAGTSMTLSGNHLTGATAVTFNSTPASDFAASSTTRITATVPAGATSGRISVTTPGGMVVSGESFVVIPPPTVTGSVPTSGPVGSSVTITGTGFSGVTRITFNGTLTTSFTVVSATQITATVPAGATSGPIAVTSARGTGTSAASFTVTAPPPPVFTPTVSLKLTGLTNGAMKLGKRVTARGKVTPTSLAGSEVKLTVQKKRATKWVTVRSTVRTITATGSYSWTHKPAARGAYRVQAAIAKTAGHTAARTTWRSFRVR